MSDNDTIRRGAVIKLLQDAYDGTIDEGALAYLVSKTNKLPAAPHEMAAREYLEACQRLCNSHPLGECKNCPLFGYECPVSIRGVADELIDTIPIVEKWAREHPERSENNGEV